MCPPHDLHPDLSCPPPPQLTQDLEELRQLLVQSRRENTRRLLTEEVTRLEVLRAEQQASQPAKKPVQPAADRVYEKKLTEYGKLNSQSMVLVSSETHRV